MSPRLLVPLSDDYTPAERERYDQYVASGNVKWLADALLVARRHTILVEHAARLAGQKADRLADAVRGLGCVCVPRRLDIRSTEHSAPCRTLIEAYDFYYRTALRSEDLPEEVVKKGEES